MIWQAHRWCSSVNVPFGPYLLHAGFGLLPEGPAFLVLIHLLCRVLLHLLFESAQTFANPYFGVFLRCFGSHTPRSHSDEPSSIHTSDMPKVICPLEFAQCLCPGPAMIYLAVLVRRQSVL